MSVLLVLVAHNGKTLQLDVHPSTRVDAVQQALVAFTGVQVSDQIVMCEGARLDPNKTLAAYSLPLADTLLAEERPVYLYSKAFLRPNAVLPQAEAVPVLEVRVPPLPPLEIQHPLHSAVSPLIRALPDYERQFHHQLVVGRAYWDTSQQRLQSCRQLLSEQEVQARAADAARANVEAHYKYICSAYQEFMDRYSTQHVAHAQTLTHFNDALAAISCIELHPQLQTDQWKRLIDLQPQLKLREWYENCRRSHDHFAAKVLELEALFSLLKHDVEALFLQAPSVDLDALGAQMASVESQVDEQSSIIQVLSKDLKTVRQLVEDTVRQLGAGLGAASGNLVHDACGAMESIHDTHANQLLPRMQAVDMCSSEFLLACSGCKARMTRDVLEQLHRISAQQSKIRDMKNKLAAFSEVLSRQDDAFQELRHVNRLPVAYRYCLAECMRRQSWLEMFAAQATKLAEHMAKVREKELSKEEAFISQVERYIPHELQLRMGLLREPPHCSISVPAPPRDAPPLLPVTYADLQRVPVDKTEWAAIRGTEAAVTRPPSVQEEAAGQPTNLEVENARLRAELASQVAMACVKELTPAEPALVKAPLAASMASVVGSVGDLSRPRGPLSTAASPVPAASAAPTRLPNPEAAVTSLQNALGLKDEYAARLRGELSALASRAQAYERRIGELESQLQASVMSASRSAGVAGRASVIAPAPVPGLNAAQTPRPDLESAMLPFASMTGAASQVAAGTIASSWMPQVPVPRPPRSLEPSLVQQQPPGGSTVRVVAGGVLDQSIVAPAAIGVGTVAGTSSVASEHVEQAAPAVPLQHSTSPVTGLILAGVAATPPRGSASSLASLEQDPSPASSAPPPPPPVPPDQPLVRQPWAHGGHVAAAHAHAAAGKSGGGQDGKVAALTTGHAREDGVGRAGSSSGVGGQASGSPDPSQLYAKRYAEVQVVVEPLVGLAAEVVRKTGAGTLGVGQADAVGTVGAYGHNVALTAGGMTAGADGRISVPSASAPDAVMAAAGAARLTEASTPVGEGADVNPQGAGPSNIYCQAIEVAKHGLPLDVSQRSASGNVDAPRLKDGGAGGVCGELLPLQSASGQQEGPTTALTPAPLEQAHDGGASGEAVQPVVGAPAGAVPALATVSGPCSGVDDVAASGVVGRQVGAIDSSADLRVVAAADPIVSGEAVHRTDSAGGLQGSGVQGQGGARVAPSLTYGLGAVAEGVVGPGQEELANTDMTSVLGTRTMSEGGTSELGVGLAPVALPQRARSTSPTSEAAQNLAYSFFSSLNFLFGSPTSPEAHLPPGSSAPP